MSLELEDGQRAEAIAIFQQLRVVEWHEDQNFSASAYRSTACHLLITPLIPSEMAFFYK
jgi:hypothetical protein